MGLFDQITSALNNPNQEASTSQLSGILNTVQQLSGGQGGDSSSTQMLMSIAGNYVRSSLQQQRSQGGATQAEALINQFAGTEPNPNALQALFSPQQQQQLVQEAAQKTGMDSAAVQNALMVVIPLVLNLLKAGQAKPGATAGSASEAGNPLLNTFLDSDGDGDVDMGDALKMIGNFTN